MKHLLVMGLVLWSTSIVKGVDTDYDAAAALALAAAQTHKPTPDVKPVVPIAPSTPERMTLTDGRIIERQGNSWVFVGGTSIHPFPVGNGAGNTDITPHTVALPVAINPLLDKERGSFGGAIETGHIIIPARNAVPRGSINGCVSG